MLVLEEEYIFFLNYRDNFYNMRDIFFKMPYNIDNLAYVSKIHIPCAFICSLGTKIIKLRLELLSKEKKNNSVTHKIQFKRFNIFNLIIVFKMAQ